MNRSLFFKFTILLTVFLFAANIIARDKQKTAELTVEINGLKTPKGKVEIKLYHSKENYKSGTTYRILSEEVKTQKVKFVFPDLPFGEYAISWYHDSNDNGEFDSNFFGMPTELYGFSNNAKGSFGPASYEDACFKIDTLKVITVLTANR